jgi:hypothetical protein
MSRYGVLVARIQNELATLNKVVQTAQSQVKKGQATEDPDFYQAAALSLQNYYMGAERIFEEVAKQIDQSLPTEANSHQALLQQMGLNIPQTRPALLSDQTLERINEYRAFRHVVIHRYGFELHPERIDELVEQLNSCHSSFNQDVEDFCQFLLRLDAAL